MRERYGTGFDYLALARGTHFLGVEPWNRPNLAGGPV
jgi:hypothetical protein